MSLTAQALFKELESGKPRPVYAIVGDEPFQAAEIAARAKAVFVKEDDTAALNYEHWDGEGLDGGSFRQALETLPGLFDAPDATRLVVCSRFDKVTTGALEAVETYFGNPAPTTCLLLFCGKADKRRAWYKAVDATGAVIEIHEPFERDWPKWLGFFERKCGKKIESEAWMRLVEGAGRTLSLVWSEVQKAACLAGDSPTITVEHCAALFATESADVFDFVEEVACRRALSAMRLFQALLRGGESEIKLLSLLVRQFRLIDQYRRLAATPPLGEGVTDAKTLASRLGLPPFVLAKVKGQAHFHPQGVGPLLDRLADCDYHMKIGEGSLFEGFLVPYFLPQTNA